MVGNEGLGGTIALEAMDVALRRGFATAGTDTGHDAAKEPGAAFAWPGPGNPNAERKVTDFAFLAFHETALWGKKILGAYYGEPPRYSYWAGCSNGGRQGLIEAQRFPEDFDGYVIGAPALHLSGTHWRGLWNWHVQAGPGAIAVKKLPLLASAVYNKCPNRRGSGRSRRMHIRHPGKSVLRLVRDAGIPQNSALRRRASARPAQAGSA